MSEETAKVSGMVHLIEETKTYGQKGFRKRLVVLEQDNGRFINYIPIDFVQDACDTVDELNQGDQVEIKYRLSGRKWQRDAESEVKYFLNAEAVSFQRLAEKPQTNEQSANDAFAEASQDDNEIPF